MKILGVTKCPVGVAHTYMAAEKLESVGKTLGHSVKVETQGSVGIENELTSQDIKEADYIIIAADVAIEGKERFVGKKVLELPIKSVIKNAEKVIDELPETAVLKKKTDGGREKENRAEGGNNESFVKYLMNGVSHMIPFVVLGGLFIALSLALGGEASQNGMVLQEGTFWYKMNAIGAIGFGLMLPILAGYIAYGIAGRAALAPAMICAQVANSPEILGTTAGTGFIGAVLVGFMAGYLIKWINTWKVPKDLRAVMPIFIIPIVSVSVISLSLILVLGTPISWLMMGLNNLLLFLSASPSTSIILGLVLGAMIAVDMGGPINKTAFLFGVASITAGNPVIMGCVAAAIPVAPLSVGLATLIGKNSFNEEEKAAGIPALLMGLIGISEGAIPFATADPKKVIPSILVGSAVSAAIAMIFKITDVVPHGGPIVGILGATNNILLYFVAIILGTLVSAFMLLTLKKRKIV